MPRTARASLGGWCYHVLNRGNARAEVFHKGPKKGTFYFCCGSFRMLSCHARPELRWEVGATTFSIAGTREPRCFTRGQKRGHSTFVADRLECSHATHGQSFAGRLVLPRSQSRERASRGVSQGAKKGDILLLLRIV